MSYTLPNHHPELPEVLRPVIASWGHMKHTVVSGDYGPHPLAMDLHKMAKWPPVIADGPSGLKAWMSNRLSGRGADADYIWIDGGWYGEDLAAAFQTLGDRLPEASELCALRSPLPMVSGLGHLGTSRVIVLRDMADHAVVPTAELRVGLLRNAMEHAGIWYDSRPLLAAEQAGRVALDASLVNAS